MVCGLGLCPYPGPGMEPFRGELGGTFCREQKTLLSLGGCGVPSWHEGTRDPRTRTRSDLKEFWEAMEERAQHLDERWLSAGSP